jgi:hypothetical protein
VTLFSDFFELTFDTRHTSTERDVGITETHLTVYADAGIETNPPRPFADALHALVGSTVRDAQNPEDSARLTFDAGTIVVSLQDADLAGDEAIHLVERTLRSEGWDFRR